MWHRDAAKDRRMLELVVAALDRHQHPACRLKALDDLPAGHTSIIHTECVSSSICWIACAGTPSPATIRVATQPAIDAAARTLKVPRKEMLHDCGVFGHSLGCATALQCADALPACRRIILLAPFTSLRAMARLKIGWALHHWSA
jgi:pimeloyl-ACP methyl ester carboxylesterase